MALTRKKKMLFATITVGGFFACCELAARVAELWVPPYNVDYGLGFDKNTRLFIEGRKKRHLLVTNPSKRMSFDVQRFPAKKDPRTLRVFMLGGSSVRRLKALPQMRLRLLERMKDRCNDIELIKCGGDSYGSHRLVMIMAEVLNYEPDLILIYSGHNEFEELEQLQWAALNRVSLDRALSHSAFVRLIRDRLTEWQIEKIQSEHDRRVLATHDPTLDWNGGVPETWGRHKFTPNDVANRMGKYRGNLESIIHMCNVRDVPVVIGTVPSNLIKPILPKDNWRMFQGALRNYQQAKFADGATIARKILRNTTGRHQSSDLENEIIRSVARVRDVPLVDVEKAVINREPHGVPGETLFADHCHLNEKGNAILLAAYEHQVFEILLRASQSSRQR